MLDILFHVLVQFIEVYIRQNRADDTSLRRSAVSVVKRPILDVSRFQEFPYQTDKTVIRNALPQDSDKYIMVDVVEEPFDVALDKPFRPVERLLNMKQCGMAAPFGSETVRGGLEMSLVNGFQNHTDDLLHQLVFKSRYSQRARFPVFLRDMHPPRRVGLITFVFQRGYQRFDPGKAHPVDTATVGAFGRAASVRCDLLVGNIEQLFVEQKPVKAFELVARILTVFVQTV